MLPTTRANAALAIAANQFVKAKQANPNANNEDVIDNLEAVPDVIKDFLKKKVGTGSSKNANLQNDNPLMGQQQVYQDLTERLTRPFRPQMSQGRAVGGVQLPPQKALEYLHNDPDFQSLPQEYQQYAIGVVGGQDALRLHDTVLQQMKGDQSLRTDARKDMLNFSESPTRMVQDRLEKGTWFVDSDNKLKKREKNPVSGMEEISPLTPWETLHAVKEAPKTGFGDLSPYINPAQAQGLQMLRDNPNASVSDIVNMVAKGKTGAIANLQNVAVRDPSLTPLDTGVSPERLATMKMLGYDQSGPKVNPSGYTDEQLGASKGPWYEGHFNPLPVAKLPGQVAGEKVNEFVGNLGTNTSSVASKIVPFTLAAGQNALSAVGKGNDWLNNFITAATGNRISGPFPQGFSVPPTTTAAMGDTIQDWLAKSTTKPVSVAPSTIPDWMQYGN